MNQRGDVLDRVSAPGSLSPAMMSDRQRRIIVAMLVGLLVLAASLQGDPSRSDWISWIAIWAGGCVLAIPCLLAGDLGGPQFGALELAAGLVLVATWLPAAISVTGLVLAHDDRRRFAYFLAVSSVLATAVCFALLLGMNCFGNAPMGAAELADFASDTAIIVAWFEFGFFIVSLGSLWTLRCCGFRLTRPGDPEIAAQLPAQARGFAACFARPAIALTLAAVALSWPAWRIEQDRREKSARWAISQELTQLGVQLEGTRAVAEKPVDAHTVRLLRDYSRFEKLQSLDLFSWPIDDAGLAGLSQLPLLEELDLSETLVTDAGMPSLCRSPRLMRISLAGTRVTAEGLATLATLPGLHLIYLPNAAVGVPAALEFQRARPGETWTAHDIMLFSNTSGIQLQKSQSMINTAGIRLPKQFRASTADGYGVVQRPKRTCRGKL